MKKQITIIFGLLVLIMSIFGAFAQTECVDCCSNGVCYGNSANSAALNIEECLVRVNDRIVKNDVTTLKAFERGQDLNVRVEFVSLQDADDVQIMAVITGYHRGSKFRDQIFDITSTFDVKANVSYEKNLKVRLPDDFKVETGDELKLRIMISDKYSHTFVREYNLKVEAPEHNLVIQDIVLDPSDSVQAGRGLFANVRIKNMGEEAEESIKITISIPELNIKATEYIDELEANEATSSEDMFLKIPSCAQPGNYMVKATVEYADGDEETLKQTYIKVTADNSCEISPITQNEKTIVTMPGKQDVLKGTQGTVYPIIISNNGVTDKAYQLSVSGLDSWATYRVEPSTLVLVKAGKTETAYLYVTAKQDATAGEKVFMVTVETSGDKKQIALTANVIESQTQTQNPSMDLSNLRQGLIIGLIVLVVLLVILGLVVGFGKMKGKEPEEVSGQTYY
ncbi:MAG: hypothetical protein QXE31_04730 [Candidatus Woesearchaeota archaeon]